MCAARIGLYSQLLMGLIDCRVMSQIPPERRLALADHLTRLPEVVSGCVPAAVAAGADGTTWGAVSDPGAVPGLGVCAPRIALARSQAAGSPAEDLAVAGSAPLCALCLQVLVECPRPIRVWRSGPDGLHPISWRDALPAPFTAFTGETER